MADDFKLSRRDCLRASGAFALSMGTNTMSRASAQICDALSFDEYSRLDAIGLADLVKRGETTPSELLEAAVQRAESVNPKIHAIVLQLFEWARDEIKHGLPDGPFTGVPFLVKDLGFFMKGTTGIGASKLWQNTPSADDGTIVKRLKNAGLVIFGRTHSPELGMLPTTESAVHGVTRNPWDLERTAGGSSGGSAAAVAAGIVPMASGSDGGGSIRIPASCCGLFGLKPTRGRVPFGPTIYEIWDGLVVIHAITRTVRDSAALLDACDGGELGDPYAHPPKTRPFLEAARTPPGKLKVAMLTCVLPNVQTDPSCIDALHEARDICRSLKHHVDDVSDQFAQRFPLRDLIQAFRTIAVVNTAMFIEQRLTELRRDLAEGDVEPTTAALFHEARSYSGLDTVKARLLMHASSRIMAEFQQDYDVILTPTLASPPIKHGVLSLSRPGLRWPEDLLDFQPSTPLANWTGQPAMSVPLYWTADDLPIGAQFIGRYGDEDTLFSLAGQLEKTKPWFHKRPNLV